MALQTTGTVRVHGLRELQRSLKTMADDAPKMARAALREVGEPVRSAAEHKAVTNITNIGSTWSRMRIGVTQRGVYLAPRARSKDKTLARPMLATQLLSEAMEPAVNESEPMVVARLDRMLATLAFRGGF